jgi:hypothetical protein
MQEGNSELEDPELEAEVRGLLDQGHTIDAIKRLREATGWRLREALIWVDRALEAGEFGPQPTRKPCPYCGQPLRTEKAKQCFNCGSDWHEASNLAR